MFFVVLLKGNNKQVIVPSNWVDKESGILKMPNGNRNLKKRKQSYEEPTEDWKNVEISKILIRDGKLKNIRQKA